MHVLERPRPHLLAAGDRADRLHQRLGGKRERGLPDELDRAATVDRQPDVDQHLPEVDLGDQDPTRAARHLAELVFGEGEDRDRPEESGLDAGGSRPPHRFFRHPRHDAVGDHHHFGVVAHEGLVAHVALAHQAVLLLELVADHGVDLGEARRRHHPPSLGERVVDAPAASAAARARAP